MMSNTLQVEAQPNDPVAYSALSALVHALYELDHVAIVRYCRTNSNDRVADGRGTEAKARQGPF